MMGKGVSSYSFTLLLSIVVCGVLLTVLTFVYSSGEAIQVLSMKYAEASSLVLLIEEIVSTPYNLTMKHELIFLNGFEIKGNELVAEELRIPLEANASSTARTRNLVLEKRGEMVVIRDA